MLPDSKQWTGGYRYFVNLFTVLDRYGRGKVRPVVFVGDDFADDALEPLGNASAEIVRSKLFSKESIDGRLVDAWISGRDRRAIDIYRSHDVHVVFESATWHGWRFPLPTIAWLPDFQHRRLPGMFSWWRRMHRELGYRAQVFSAAAIMLSSDTARRDCETFHPASKGKVNVVPFSVEPGDEAYTVSEATVRARYKLEMPYFYLPNQYWRHKNHALIVEALLIMRNNDTPVTIVASGSEVDPRHPGLMHDLKGQVEQSGLREHFRFLGLVPRSDMYALMRGSIAVLNPSLFEGWSTTVEEAKAMGVALVLSDIAVHREQASKAAYYFDPQSPEDTAALLSRVHAEKAHLCGDVSQAENQSNNALRLQDYALRIEELIERVFTRSRSA